MPAGPVPPVDPPPVAGRRIRARTVAGAAAVVAALLAAATGAVVLRPEGQPAAVARVATTPPRPPTPFERAGAALDAQAAALLKGDEKGWLAAVDPSRPKLQTRYRALYASLRALDLSDAEYRIATVPGDKLDSGRVGAELTYCFAGTACPAWQNDAGLGPPRLLQTLTFRTVGDRYVITGFADAYAHANDLQPTPWERGGLVYARGKRVTVAGPRSQKKHLRSVLRIAERAAVVNDRFAGYVGNPQPRYRVYLADSKAWKSWYGGIDEKWTVGYAIPLNTAGSDVVLRMSELLKDRKLMTTTIQHELGHVVTVGGVTGYDSDRHLWLSEGIAEYIGWSPEPARASWNRYGARAAFRDGKPPKTIAAAPFGAKASDRTVGSFYAMGHFAADCMADRYGERRLFTFVRMVLREEQTYDKAARAAFGKSFATVDKGCLTWIRSQV